MSRIIRGYSIRGFSLISVQVLTSILLVFLLAAVVSAAGVFDPNFGNGGKVFFRFRSDSTDFANAAALQPDGKIVMVGRSGLDGQIEVSEDFAVARLNTDGSLDMTFGSGGLVTTDFGSHDRDYAASLVIQPNGKIVVGGSTITAAGVALARYNSNGSLDATFGEGGLVAANVGGARTLLLQADGKIICEGASGLTRFNTDGTLDTSFGDNGTFTIQFGFTSGIGGGAIQPDGKILISGGYGFHIVGCVPTKTMSCDRFQSFLLRYTPQLMLDKKFGRKFGKEFTRAGETESFGYFSLQSDGSILAPVLGSQPRRYTPNGRLETIFDPTGFPVDRLVQRPDGKIGGCGLARSGGYDDFGTVLFDRQGHLAGSDQVDLFGGNDDCTAILAQPDGRIVVVGAAQMYKQGPYGFAVVRYLDLTQ